MIPNYSNGLKKGDLITAYHKGIWRVTKIERRFYTQKDIGGRLLPDGSQAKPGDEYNSLIYYHLVMSSDYKLVKSKRKNFCDASFCWRIDKFIASERNKLDELEQQLEKLQGC